MTIERRRRLVVWPVGGAPEAFRALCPHDESSLVEATFDDREPTRPPRRRRFDGVTGACVSGRKCGPVEEYALKIEDGAIFVDVPEKVKTRPRES